MGLFFWYIDRLGFQPSLGRAGWLALAKVSTLINGIQGKEIFCKRELRKVDPLSPLIFVIVANKLYYMIANCRDLGLIKGLSCRDDANVVIILHYADDNLILGKKCLAQAMILKWIMICFEKWSGLTINYQKSALMFIGEISIWSFLLSLIFNCLIKSLPITYLGLSLTTGRLNRSHWISMIIKV